MKHKTFRALLSLVLVCVLLIGWSPIRAQASVLGGTALLFGDDAIAIILAVLGGLGVCAVAGSETSDLESRAIARSALDALEDAGTFVKNGALTVYTNVTEAWSYAVSTDLVQWLHNWLWADSAVLGTSYLPDVKFDSSAVNSAIYDASLHAYAVLLDSPDCAYVAYADTPFVVTPRPDGGYDLKTEDGSSFYSWREVWNSWNYHSKTSWFSSGTIHYFGQANPSVTTTYDVALGTVAPPGTEIETEYGDYVVIVAPNGVPDTGGDGGDDEQPKIPVLPVPYLPPSEIPNVPQEDIWKGNKVEIENPDSGDTPDPMPDTDIDIGTGTDGSLSQTPWETFKKWISEGWQSIIQAIPTPESIAEAVGNVIKHIFVPDADFISDKWNSIRSRFDFADSISSSGELILDVLNGIDPEPPVIYIDLGASEGSYDIGGEVPFLDLRWYERYKPTGDAIISAFLWLVFAWRMFIKLPGIIGGLPGDFVMQGVVNLGLSEHLPARKKEYEYERQQNRRSMKK